MSTSESGTNPKDLIGVRKSPLRFVPPALEIFVAPAMANGAAKYGPYNWRDTKIKYTVYLEAIKRHLLALMDGEDLAPDSGLHHGAHIGANIAILADALALGLVVDDRPKPGPAAKMMAEQDQSAPR